MGANIFKTVITLLALALAGVHLFIPGLKIDLVTIILLVLAVMPWILRHIKGFEIPGVVRIDLSQAKAATDKVLKSDVRVNAPAGELIVTGHAPEVRVTQQDPIETLRRVAEADSKLALVGFRIEVEKRLLQLARTHNLPTERKSLVRLVSSLRAAGILPQQAASGLLDLTAMGNSAAHGAEVSDDAADWVLDAGTQILGQLDELIREHTQQDNGT